MMAGPVINPCIVGAPGGLIIIMVASAFPWIVSDED